MSTSVCKWAIRIAWVLYLVSLAVLLIGTYGLFGQERDPLSAVFLVPIGLPWALWLDGFFPEGMLPWLAILSPALNILILTILCRIVARGRN